MLVWKNELEEVTIYTPLIIIIYLSQITSTCIQVKEKIYILYYRIFDFISTVSLKTLLVFFNTNGVLLQKMFPFTDANAAAQGF